MTTGSEKMSTDVLEALAPLLKVEPVIEDFCRFGGSWESPHEPRGRGAAQFHIVTRGSCWLSRPGREDLPLSAGDILLLPHGDNHVVRSCEAGAARAIATDVRNGIFDRATEGIESDTELLCGRLLFDGGGHNPLLAALPEVILIRTAEAPMLERFRRILTDIRDEVAGDLAGSRLIAADFARALFVMMLRDHLAEKPEQDGILSLLSDRTTARVILAMLREPARPWTLDELASAGITSRASLVRSFRKLTGHAPMHFLTEMRLMIARQRLAGTADPIAQIAAEVGYQSEGALSKAMVQRFGRRPGALRMADAAEKHG